ncbi:MAG TPA: glutamate--cysteine ligase [Candidatus Competibacteraceae bacterium]|nr:glutamate--cysteine ligase [Candidatus Competibacteraceae bacterium]HSA45095.1 glutamate--cysteine ligase [Candidatus Competibacteraceae bacterium]
MHSTLHQRLTRLFNADPHSLLKGRLLGLEREALRVAPDGYISQIPHPAALGSALTHPSITTDYSEALLEFVTPPLPGPEALLQCLDEIHRFVYPRIGDELLWSASMPCILAGEASIPIAEYGRSNLGRMKHIYRRGLAWRYGRIMQVIAGIHFNFSLSDEFWAAFQTMEGDRRTLQDFRSESYFGLIRNLQRFGWLILYLFGASPAVCKSFLDGKATTLPEFDDHTCYGLYATSLRMSNVGYTNRTEKKSGVNVCYNSLPEYIASLTQATRTSWPPYEQIGVKVAGEYRQLNANILQIENEYYTSMRPKQPPQGNEKPTIALQRRGVAYVELRSVDINPLEPLGVTVSQLRFLEAFLLFCLLAESPPFDAEERRMIDDNQMATALTGRDPALVLQRRRVPALPLRHWAEEILEQLQPVCELLDMGAEGRLYAAALAEQRAALADPERTPSARMLAKMRASGENFFRCAQQLSEQHRRFFESPPLAEERTQFFTEAAKRSWREQRELEATDDLSFDEFLNRYFAQE